MTYWRRLVAFIGVVAFVTAAACGQSLAHAAPTIYAYDAAAQHSSTTTEHHGVNGTAIRASLLAEDGDADDPARPARHFVAAETGSASLEDLVASGSDLDPADAGGQLERAGRAYAKAGEVFGSTSGGPSAINAAG